MRYCPYFCEENIWHLAQDDVVKDGERVISHDDRRVVFVSNENRAVPMDHQKAGQGSVVVWDYHVVLFALARSGWQCWDLDHDKGAPRDVAAWLKDSFLIGPALEAYRQLTRQDFEAPRFRVIAAPELVDELASDRSHMIDGKGRRAQPFPDWPAIGQAHDDKHNLMRFVDTRAAWHGEVMSYDELRLHYGMK